MSLAALAEDAKYAVITEDVLAEIFDQRMMSAALYSRVRDEEMAFTAKMVFSTLAALRSELQRRIA